MSIDMWGIRDMRKKETWKEILQTMKPVKGTGPKRLNANVLRLLILGWLLPLTVMSVTVIYVVTHQMERQTREATQESMDSAVDICEVRLKSSIQVSRNASYIPDIKQSWKNYLLDENGQKLYDEVYEFTSRMYKYDENFLSTIVYFYEKPEPLCAIYSGIADADYDSVRFFKENSLTAVKELASEIDTRIGFLSVDNHLYMVRNIVDRDFTPFAFIVMELDKKVIFQSLRSLGWYEDAAVFVDGQCIYSGTGEAEKLAGHLDPERQNRASLYQEEGREAFVYKIRKMEGHEIAYLVRLDYGAIHYERTSMILLMVLTLLFTIPLIAIIFWFLYKNVNRPVQRLVESAHEIEAGNFGYQIASRESSEEFSYLVNTFNSMSDKLKTQFEQIYLEELALKDADIKALQSQINPHFLNNTLEIINWEARMNGNDKVSSMIEALSTMLEATLNRKKQPMIPLSEELEYVDAYCYIIRQRFGDKLQFEKRIDQTLLREEVPRLIIQPIIENAVEHGLAGRQGKIGIRIYSDRDKLRIEVINDGVLTEKDRARIEMLLNEKNDAERSVSLGICNVNKRLKIIYGADCGLTIRSDKDGCTVSTITVKLHK